MTTSEYRELIRRITRKKNEHNLEGMRRIGINVTNAYGSVSVPELRKIGKTIGKNHDLAIKLWSSGIHEARLLASLIDEPDKVTESQMDRWAMEFDSWDICDQCCGNLFDKTAFAYSKAVEWSLREDEYVRRAGYVLMAELAVHDKDAGNEIFIMFFKYIKEGSVDDRNFVKKAVNWALRQIGKRNDLLRKKALEVAEDIKNKDSKSAKWVANDAIRELRALEK
jgi:3-methyladenine DNA glycosylase AlkD